MTIIRHRMRAQTAITPHQGNRRILVPKRAVGGATPPVDTIAIMSTDNQHVGFQLSAIGALAFAQGNTFTISFKTRLDSLSRGVVSCSDTTTSGRQDGVTLHGNTSIFPNEMTFGFNDAANSYPFGFDILDVVLNVVATFVREAANNATFQTLVVNDIDILGGSKVIDISPLQVLRFMAGFTSRNDRCTLWNYKIRDQTAGIEWSFPLEEGTGVMISTVGSIGGQIITTTSGSEPAQWIWVDDDS